MHYIIARFVYQKRYQLWVNEEGLVALQGVWGTKIDVLNWRNIQLISLATSPYQRTHKYISIVIFTAGKRIFVPYLKRKDAIFITNYALLNFENEK